MSRGCLSAEVVLSPVVLFFSFNALIRRWLYFHCVVFSDKSFLSISILKTTIIIIIIIFIFLELGFEFFRTDQRD